MMYGTIALLRGVTRFSTSQFEFGDFEFRKDKKHINKHDKESDENRK